MSQLQPKVAITSIAIVSIIAGTYYFTSTPGIDLAINHNNSAISQDNSDQATLVSSEKYHSL